MSNDIIIFNLIANPDGRIDGWRQNGNGFDCNRDMATQSQPEVQAILEMVTEWKPLVLIDNHGYVSPILIEPCGKPHNPNYEEDIYQKWALEVAETMEDKLKEENWLEHGEDAVIPIRDEYANGGWDDYPAIFIPQLSQFYALTTHTIEVGPRTYKGVLGHYISNKTALIFAADNKTEMFNDQVEVFKRGTNFGGPNGGEFPYAYVIPVEKPLQKNPQQVAETIEYLLKAGVQIETATQDFAANGKDFPKGTYIIPMNQPLAGLANNLLWKGEDIEEAYPEVIASGEGMYDIAAWNFPELWGFDREIVEDEFDVKTSTVTNARFPSGQVDNEKSSVYALACDGNEAIKAVNSLLAKGIKVYQTETAENDVAAGTFFIEADNKSVNTLKDLARKYGLYFTASSAVPENSKELKKVRIAALTAYTGSKLSTNSSGTSKLYNIGPMAFVLRDLGFEVDVLWPGDLSEGLDSYDIIVGLENITSKTAGITADGWNNLKNFFDNGGKYVGYGRGGADFANSLDILKVTYKRQSSNYNAIVNVDYDQSNAITGSYEQSGTGFVYGPLYFSAYGDDTKVLVNYGKDVFFAGYWLSKDRTEFSGKAAVVKNDTAVLFGLDPIFRAHIKDSFRMVANSIFNLTSQK